MRIKIEKVLKKYLFILFIAKRRRENYILRLRFSFALNLYMRHPRMLSFFNKMQAVCTCKIIKMKEMKKMTIDKWQVLGYHDTHREKPRLFKEVPAEVVSAWIPERPADPGGKHLQHRPTRWRDRKEWMKMRVEGNLANGEQPQICLTAAYAGKRVRAVEKTICMKSTKILERHEFE